MHCAACGFENAAGGRFCEECGASLAAACPTCGAPVRAGARFCPSCGAGLRLADGTSGAATAASREPGAAAPRPIAERRLVTVLFCDLVGFTTLAEDRDPETVRELLSGYFAETTRIIELHGGAVEKFIGDAVMAVWGTPVAHEDDAERAVRAALEIVDAVPALHADLRARAGVLTGEAAVTLGATNQGMVAGDLVNTAARLQGVAEPGTVLVGEATMRAAEMAVAFEQIGDQSLKGKRSPVPAWQALRVVAQRGGHRRADALEAPFVGREEELRQLKEQLHAAGRDRRLRLVSITGPGGIGKSRLVWELEKYIDGVAEDIFWHRGRSPSYGEGVAFWALGEMVRRRAGLGEDADEATTRERIAATLEEYVDDAGERERIGPALLSLLGVEPAPAGARETLFPAWRAFFEHIAQHGTTVLAFEDLQWADSGLLDFLEHLLDWSRNLPILVVTLARPELFDRRPDWAASRRNLIAIGLEPLSDDDVRLLLQGLVPGLPDGVVATITERAGGIPLYAVETVRALLADGRIERVGETFRPVGDLSQLRVPESLRLLIASRLDALDPVERAMMQDASVLGQVFAAPALAEMSGVASPALDAHLQHLVRGELLDVERDPSSPERGMYKFVQSLIREVAYSTLARRERRSRHLAAARILEASADEELSGALADHYVAAHEASDPGPEADAVATQARLALAGAAERAASLGSHDQAVAYLERAIAVTSASPERAALMDRAAISASAATHPRAVELARAAVAAYREMGDEAGAVSAEGRLGYTMIEAGDPIGALELLEEALAHAEPMDDPPRLAEILARLARARFRAGRHEQALAAADRALQIADPLGLEAVVAEAMGNKAPALANLNRFHEATAIQRAAVELARKLPSRLTEARMTFNLAAIMSELDPVTAAEYAREAMELSRKAGDKGQYIWGLFNVALEEHQRAGDWEGSMRQMDEALDASLQPSDRARLLLVRAIFRIARGDPPGEVVRAVDEAVGDFRDPHLQSDAAAIRAEAAVVEGRFAEAYRHAMRAGEIRPQGRRPFLIIALRAAVLGGDDARVREVATEIAGERGGAAALGVRRHAEGCVAALDGHVADAVAAFRDGIQVYRAVGFDLLAAEIALAAVTYLPDHPEVRGWASFARETYERIGAKAYLDILDRLSAPSRSSAFRQAVDVPVEDGAVR